MPEPNDGLVFVHASGSEGSGQNGLEMRSTEETLGQQSVGKQKRKRLGKPSPGQAMSEMEKFPKF